MTTVTTRDVASAIGFALMGTRVTQLTSSNSKHESVEINFVDESDQHNPVLVMDNGQRFRVSVTSV